MHPDLLGALAKARLADLLRHQEFRESRADSPPSSARRRCPSLVVTDEETARLKRNGLEVIHRAVVTEPARQHVRKLFGALFNRAP